MATVDQHRESWYGDAMESRERELARVLGPSSPADQVFKPFDENFELTAPGFAFLRFPPAPNRPFWLYVTHGVSQPIDFEDFCNGYAGGGSGLGVEFGLATATEETWPFALLELLSNYVLGSSRPVLPGDRIPSSDLMQEAHGGGLMALSTPAFGEFKTLSGTFDLMQLVGITAGELKRAKAHPGRVGSRILELVLQEFGIGGITDRERPCTTRNSQFDRIWREKTSSVDADE